eukprot:14567804-Alexandrium_andersonii.AAC.1
MPSPRGRRRRPRAHTAAGGIPSPGEVAQSTSNQGTRGNRRHTEPRGLQARASSQGTRGSRRRTKPR